MSASGVFVLMDLAKLVEWCVNSGARKTPNRDKEPEPPDLWTQTGDSLLPPDSQLRAERSPEDSPPPASVGWTRKRYIKKYFKQQSSQFIRISYFFKSIIYI